MKTSTIVVAALASSSFGSSTLAFQATTTPCSITHHHRQHSSSSTTLYEYIPSGFTKQSWATFKAKEEQAKKAKNLGKKEQRYAIKKKSFWSKKHENITCNLTFVCSCHKKMAVCYSYRSNGSKGISIKIDAILPRGVGTWWGWAFITRV